MALAAAHSDERGAWLAESRALLVLGGPLMAAQLAQIGIQTVDVVMLGWLSPTALAAGALASAVIHPVLMLCTGVVMAVAPMVSQAIGAKKRREARRAVRQGLWVSILLSSVAIPPLLDVEGALLWAGQDPAVAAGTSLYLSVAALSLAPQIAFGCLRGFISAHGESRVVLWAMLAGVAVNALGNYALIFGELGMPRLELLGAGIATLLTYAAVFLVVLRHATVNRRYRRYALLARFHRPDWPRFWSIWRLGLPIGFTIAAETGLFAASAFLMGLISADALAGHAVALQLASLTFMIPLGLSFATTVRVGRAKGAGDAAAMARAAWAAMALTLAFMLGSAAMFWVAPGPLTALFLNPQAAPAPFAVAVAVLAVAAVFQLVDGAQVSAVAALRGLGDTARPMLIAIGSYWGVGLPGAWLLAFPLGFGPVGVWWGLALGLTTAAFALTWRLTRALKA